MNLCAIICEYNPFHYGHLYHLQQSKELSGADGVLCIMSGNFTQRGEPTVCNKYVRASMALESGADIVVQMPTAYACSSAEIFALAGVKIANSFKNVTHLAFGCETKSYDLLKEIAKYFADEPKEFKEALSHYLEQGNSLVVSRQKAIEQLIKENKVEFSEITETLDILQKPNNILAIEYLKALYKTNSTIEPVFINRGESDYHSDEVNGKDTSATAIRVRLADNPKTHSIRRYMPKFAYKRLHKEIKEYGMPDNDLFSDLCMYKLKTANAEELKNLYDVNEGLENRFIESAQDIKDLNELLLDVKSKRYTYTRLKRIVLRQLLSIEKSTIEKIYKIDKLPYIKVLGFRSDREDLLRDVDADTNLIIRNSNVVQKPTEFYKDLASIEDRANAVYNLLLKKSKHTPKYSPDLLTKTIKL